jgi:hypothetical protein
MKNKQNRDFTFFFIDDILYDNKTTNLTLQKVPKEH